MRTPNGEVGGFTVEVPRSGFLPILDAGSPTMVTRREPATHELVTRPIRRIG
ncbi:MAG: hypothetical protein KGJ92_07670 [Actinomycetales bacterium]|nr:hypothetical protein [Actinomycetales bacterium]